MQRAYFRTIKNDDYYLLALPGNIVLLQFNDHYHLKLKDAKRLKEDIVSLSNNQPFYLLIRLPEFKESISLKALKVVIKSRVITELLLKAGVVVTTSRRQVIFNYLFKRLKKKAYEAFVSDIKAINAILPQPLIIQGNEFDLIKFFRDMKRWYI
jgi:hypothetical protein